MYLTSDQSLHLAQNLVLLSLSLVLTLLLLLSLFQLNTLDVSPAWVSYKTLIQHNNGHATVARLLNHSSPIMFKYISFVIIIDIILGIIITKQSDDFNCPRAQGYHSFYYFKGAHTNEFTENTTTVMAVPRTSPLTLLAGCAEHTLISISFTGYYK